MSKHTSGPWAIRRSSNGYPYQIFAVNGDPKKPGGICDVTRWASIAMPASPEGVANAALIAAAPCLLKALEEIEAMETPDANATARRMGATARAAITKARGE
jgi:hypothetical protein